MIKLISVLIPAIVLLITYLLGDKRKIQALTREIEVKENELKTALAKSDVNNISIISHDLAVLRQKLNRLKGKR